MNRKQLIAWLKSIGYTGPVNDLAKVKSWLELEGFDPTSIDVQDGEKSYRVGVDAVWAKGPKAAVIGQSDDAATGKKSKAGSAKADGDEDGGENTADELRRELRELQAKYKGFEEKMRLSGGDEALATSEAEDDEQTHRPRRGTDAKAWRHRGETKAYNRRANDGKTNFPDAEIAEGFAANLRLQFMAGSGKSYEGKARDLMIVKANQVEFDDTLGGSLVPVEYSTFYQKVREKYGAARQLARVVTMSRDVMEFPRRQLGTAASFTVYAPGEGGTITSSAFKVSKVKLVAQKLAALTIVSNELFNDSALNVSDMVSDELAWSFSVQEDACYFKGDGTQTYFGINGLSNSFKGLNGTVANISGLFQASSATWASQTLGDLETMFSYLPDLDGVAGDPVIVCNKRYFWQVMARLQLAGGGNTTETIGGKVVPTFAGYRVVTARQMPRVGGTSTDIPAYFGNPEYASTIGDVNGGISIASSTDRYFDADAVGIRATERIAISIHDIGDSNATEASRNPGPLVGLIQP